ncbi:TPA: ABC transporter permease [Clostridioides difficile]|uniref:ABC transporter permease n=1 Tax=Clostridioides difficile TaxID=1496 RepID=UPI0007BB7A06|nr:ABC transporter permease [Clostridioides difficile]EGT4184907.1 ABC transporter permease [Clostridioides difficile]EGT4217722.1 ABC transporter permease [Clostridioides difficile]MDL0336362.1 FtsX-like permease family protein [Clostridioides difficile]CZR72046.1 ABC transporter permease [Clostridium difficile 630] [Clostridioides difficile]CZR76555.1 ABC transporter permease YtrF precursor [Clostridioides difficile]
MKNYLSLSIKELKSQKLMTTFIIIAIVLSTIMTTVVGQSIGILQNLRIEQARSFNGDRHVSFHQLTKNQVDDIKKDDRVYQAGTSITIGSSKIKDSGISVLVKEYDKTGLSNYPKLMKLKSGHLPKDKNEIALDENTLKLMGIKPRLGVTIPMNLDISLLNDTIPPYNYTANFKLSGILEDDYTGYVSGIVNGIVGKGTSENLLPKRYTLSSLDFKIKQQEKFQEIVNQLAKKINLSHNSIQYNWIYLNALKIQFEKDENSSNSDGISMIILVSLFVALLVLLASGLVIYNILKISVTKKIKEYGCLRAIGAEPNQIYKIVILQILILCTVAIPIGAVIGIIFSKGITGMVTNILNPDILLANDNKEITELIHKNTTAYMFPLVLSTNVSLIFSFISALPSAIYASHVSPKIAMVGSTTKIKRKIKREKTIKNFERHLAWLNLKRNKGRTIITILSLFMSITVFVALSEFSNVLDVSRSVSNLKEGDFSLTNEISGFNKSTLDKIAKMKNVNRTSFIKYSEYKQGEIDTDINFENSGEMLKIIGIDEQTLKDLMPSITDSILEDFKNGSICFIKNPIAISTPGVKTRHTNLKPKDSITINKKQLDIYSTVDKMFFLQGNGWINGVDVIVYDSVYNTLTNKNKFNQINIYAKDKSKLEQIRLSIEQICENNPGSHWISYIESDKQLKESFKQIEFLAWAVILFVGLIGTLNIINTTHTNINTRTNEIGVKRAIGMSNSSLYKMFLWEGVYYGIFAAIFGSIAGYASAIIINMATIEKLDFTNIPITSILQATIISVLACIIATLIPLRKVKKMNIIDCIDINL